jgi:hypothetical protein
MAHGIKLWNQDNFLVFDSTQTLARYIAKGTANSSPVSVPGMVNDGTWHVFGYKNGEGFNYVPFTINNGNFSFGTTPPVVYYVFRAVTP